ncbi:MAG TPA: hypothetical protein VMJ65_20225 [Solirubrobacteraceae bacterium]|nr:hypothetical protein [Solirubrobacteraceae bacterium]
MTTVLAHLRRSAVPYVALLLVLAVGLGGGYALAAGKTKSITVCADKKTGILHLHNHGKCKRGQTRVTWNQQGPQGAPGPTGQPGTPAVSVWAQVATNGSVAFGQGLVVQHAATAGAYQVTITAPACAHGSNAPVISVSDAASVGGAFPVAWFGSTGGNQTFMVFTGVVSGGTFTPMDRTFTVIDTCM